MKTKEVMGSYAPEGIYAIDIAYADCIMKLAFDVYINSTICNRISDDEYMFQDIKNQCFRWLDYKTGKLHCDDTCTPEGTKVCLSNTTYKYCSKYGNDDPCLEWTTSSCGWQNICVGNGDCQYKPS